MERNKGTFLAILKGGLSVIDVIVVLVTLIAFLALIGLTVGCERL